MQFALGIFAKEPIAGEVKTRLCPPLTAAQAAEFYRLSLDETIQLASAAESVSPVIFYTGNDGFFHEQYPQLERYPQQGSDLGQRMEHALRMLLKSFDAAALIGTDTPDLPATLLTEAREALGVHDVVVAPSTDGGYVLIGESRHHPQLFRDVPWSTPEVLTVTRNRARDNQIPLKEISQWEDVDDIHDLKRLLVRSPASRCALWAGRNLTASRG